MGDDCVKGHSCKEVVYYKKDANICVEAKYCAAADKKDIGGPISKGPTCYPLNWVDAKKPEIVKNARCTKWDDCKKDDKSACYEVGLKSDPTNKNYWCLVEADDKTYSKGKELTIAGKEYKFAAEGTKMKKGKDWY